MGRSSYPGADRREADFAARCSVYAEALGAPALPGADVVKANGITFTVPADGRQPSSLSDRILRGRLPLRMILSTREMIGRGVMLDVGANIGTTSFPRAILGDFDVIYAAEPDPTNYACLVRGIVDNGLRGVVLPDRVALSNVAGKATLRQAESMGAHALDGPGAGFEVCTDTLTGWLQRVGVDAGDVNYIKIDTQGRESHILEGAGELLGRRGTAWQLECSPYHLELSGRSVKHLVQQLASAFTTFIDLNPEAPGRRVRPVAELGEALSYLQGTAYTDLLVY